MFASSDSVFKRYIRSEAKGFNSNACQCILFPSSETTLISAGLRASHGPGTVWSGFLHRDIPQVSVASSPFVKIGSPEKFFKGGQLRRLT